MSYNRVEASKRRANPFSFNKCLHFSNLTRTLFPCKSNRNALNYDYFHYEPSTTNETAQSFSPPNESLPPATSTMIQAGFVYNQTADSYVLPSGDSHDSSLLSCIAPAMSGPNYVTLVSDQHFNTSQDLFYELEEETCKSNLSDTHDHSCSIVSLVNNDYEDITIKHNNSPISTFYEQDTLSNTSGSSSSGYLHSTEISNEDKETRLSRNFSTTSSIMASPVSTSTSFDSSRETVGAESDAYGSLMGMFASETIDTAGATHVCAETYEATFVGDVSVHFADTIRIVRDNHDEWLYVRVASDGREGYVPRTIVIDLKQFVDQLVKTKSALVQHLFN
jgi:hypothetical protein